MPQALEEAALLHRLQGHQRRGRNDLPVQCHLDHAQLLALGDRRLQRLRQVHARLQAVVLAARGGHQQRHAHANRHLVGFTLPDLRLRQRLARLVQLVRFVETEAPVEQRLRIHRALVLAGVAHHHGDQALFAALGRRHQAIARGRGVAGLDAVHRRVAPQQQVAVRLGDRADRQFLDLVVAVRLGEVADQRAAEDGEVARGGDVALGGEAVRVHEVRPGHPNLLRVGIHELGEGRLAAGDVLGQGDRGIVAGLHHHALFHLDQRRGLVDLETAVAAIGAGATAAPGILAHHHLVGRLDLAGGHFGGDHVAGHDLGDAGRIHRGIDVFARQHLAGGVIHHQPGLGGGRRGCVRNRQVVAERGGLRRRRGHRGLGEGEAGGGQGDEQQGTQTHQQHSSRPRRRGAKRFNRPF